jgi:hypothetical protein
MVVWAQVGNGPNVGILILLLRLFFDIFVFFCDVVDARLVLFTVRIDHRGSVTTTRVAFSLHVAFLFTVTAHNIGIARTVVADWGSVGGRGPCGRGVEVVTGWLLTTHSGDLIDVLVLQFVPENGSGLLGLHNGFEGSNLLRAFAVILDGLKLSGKFKALLKVGLASLQNPVTQRIFDAGQEKLVLEE